MDVDRKLDGGALFRFGCVIWWVLTDTDDGAREEREGGNGEAGILISNEEVGLGLLWSLPFLLADSVGAYDSVKGPLMSQLIVIALTTMKSIGIRRCDCV